MVAGQGEEVGEEGQKSGVWGQALGILFVSFQTFENPSPEESNGHSLVLSPSPSC